eukprot:618846-Pleurochrysis_carterae.AAC.2
MHADVLVDQHGWRQVAPCDAGALLRVADDLREAVAPRLFPLARRAVEAAVVRREAAPAWDNPNLDEAQRVGLQIVLRVHDAGARSHELDRSAAKRLTRAHRVLVCQRAVDDVCDDLHVAVWVSTKATLALHEVVVHHAEHAVHRVLGIVILSEGEMKAAAHITGKGTVIAEKLARVSLPGHSAMQHAALTTCGEVRAKLL